MMKNTILWVVGLISLQVVVCLKTPELCQLPAKVGHCKASMPRYFYNNQTNQCEKFSYGGCDGNDDNFLRLEDCQICCSDSSHKCTCFLPPKSGPCLALIPRYYYDSASGECKGFTYGGCQPNSNNFKTIEECLGVCPKTDFV